VRPGRNLPLRQLATLRDSLHASLLEVCPKPAWAVKAMLALGLARSTSPLCTPTMQLHDHSPIYPRHTPGLDACREKILAFSNSPHIIVSQIDRTTPTNGCTARFFGVLT
jgi:hypothetical protein